MSRLVQDQEVVDLLCAARVSGGGACETRTDLVSVAVTEELTRLAYRDRVVAFGVNRTTV
jgi:hypothetical protein